MIDFTLTDEQRAMRDLAHTFAEQEIRPVAAELDEREAFPWDSTPRYLLRDREAIYGTAFAAITKSMGIGKVSDRKTLIFWGMLDPGFPRPILRDLRRFSHTTRQSS